MGCETTGIRPVAGRVMYLGAEDEADEFHRRLADITYQHQRQMSNLSDFRLIPMADRHALLAVPDRAGVMQPTENMVRLRERLTEFRPGFLVLDTSRICLVATRSSETMSASSLRCCASRRSNWTWLCFCSRTLPFRACKAAQARPARPPGATACAVACT
jgi:hypothetical protein